MGIYIKEKDSYFALEKLDYVHTWRKEWFYLKDRAVLGQQYGLAPFDLTARVARRNTWRHVLTAAELAVVEPLVLVIEKLDKWVSGGRLIVVFLRRRIQPLQFWAHSMWRYTGIDDPTRCLAANVTGSALLFWV